jgi:phenylalanyl-tRNA synthetase beta chain
MEVTDVIGDEPIRREANGGRYFAPFPVEFNIDRAHALIGKELGEELIERILRAMEVEIYSKENKVWQLGVPRYRVDVQRECDVVEDILRIYGYNNVEFPEKLNTSLSYNPKPNPVALQIRISEQLTAQGFNEILNNSLTKLSYYEPLEQLSLATCVKIMNPLSQDLGVMRQTLLFGGLESIQRNANRKNADLKFYEFGNCYHYNAQKIADRQAKDPHWTYDPLYAYSEEPHLALWLTGNKTAQSWVQKEEKTSFYTLHAYVNNVLRRLGVNIANCILEPLESELCSDGLVIKAPNGKAIGFMGIVNSKLLKAFDIDNPVYYADLDWNMLLRLNKQYKPVINDLPKFPEVKRDFALLVDKTVKFADLAKAAMTAEKKLLKDVTLFDVYTGDKLEAGKKSYALGFVLQDESRTLDDKTIDNTMAKLIDAFAKKAGATIR